MVVSWGVGITAAGGSSDGAAAGGPEWGGAAFRLNPAVLLVRGEVMSAARVSTAVLVGRAVSIPAPWLRAAAWVCTAVLTGRAEGKTLALSIPYPFYYSGSKRILDQVGL